MKARKLLFVIFLFFSSTTILFSQDAAQAIWHLTDPANNGTGFASTIQGSIIAPDELFQGTEISGYTGPNNSQRIRMAGTNNTWAANLKNQIDTVYVQFAVAPKNGVNLTITNVSLLITGMSTNTMKANIWYSTKSDFSNPIQITFNTGITGNYLTRENLSQVSDAPNVTIAPTDTFYLRIYPWNEDSAVKTGKYLCLQDVEVTAVTSSGQSELILSTLSVESISFNSALSGGNIVSDGGSSITERGVCWNTSGSPTILDSKTNDGTGTGIYQSSITNLSSQTKYYVRAYATNSAGTTYGNELMFTTTAEPMLAFPTAEGYGRFTTGGRGGTVYEVTNLNDDNNPGSLRYAINQSGPRTIVFRISGTIFLNSSLSIKNGDLTIAGQTAPGDGICVAGFTPSINCDNVVVRFIRFRLGDINNVEDDAFNGRNHKDIIIDHCSMTWSVDECASFYDNANFTMQWCIIGESLYRSVHDKGDHGYGGIQGGWGATFHHNLYINNTSRNPRFCGARYHHSTANLEVVDFVNNVIYNWGFNSAYGGELGQQNVRSNYYKYGPATSSGVRNRIVNPTTDPGTNSSYGKFYVADNYVEGYPNTTEDNWATGVQGINTTTRDQIKVDTPFPIAQVKTQPAETIFESVLGHVGANFPKLDSVDSRLINEARSGIATYEGVYKTVKNIPDNSLVSGIIDSQSQVGGWPVLTSLPAPTDSDHDGMPDDWEDTHGLNKNDPNDGNMFVESGYTNLEEYLNSLVEDAVTSVENERQIPADFYVNQNYPNPFNPTTTINYSIPEAGRVDINIYNIQGQLINSLFSNENNAGTHEVVWNGKNQFGISVGSGIYFCTIRYAQNIKTIKMLLLK